jgi:hypothetical protein
MAHGYMSQEHAQLLFHKLKASVWKKAWSLFVETEKVKGKKPETLNLTERMLK